MEHDLGPVANALEVRFIIIDLISQLPRGSDVRTIVVNMATSGHAQHLDGYFKTAVEASLNPDDAFEEGENGKEHDADESTAQRLFLAKIDRDRFTQCLH